MALWSFFEQIVIDFFCSIGLELAQLARPRWEADVLWFKVKAYDIAFMRLFTFRAHHFGYMVKTNVSMMFLYDKINS